ncbi:MAG: 30S ribosomal protein S17e [Nanoarchaeota archaeon]
MGRIKSTMIKRTGEQLVELVDVFTGDFEQNKKFLKNTMPSKSIRNKVAGYIVRLKKSKN